MQTRDYKNFSPGAYYHIYNRGNAKEDIFRAAEDYQFFLLRLRQNIAPDGKEPRMFRPLPPESFSLVAYCLMPNHFHLVVRQNKDIPTSKLLGKLCTSYSKYFNQKYQRIGHVFQDQFKQKEIQNNDYLLSLSAYVHLNPVKDGFVKTASAWPWSSVREYQKNLTGFVKSDVVLNQIKPASYTRWLQEAGEAAAAFIEPHPAKGAL